MANHYQSRCIAVGGVARCSIGDNDQCHEYEHELDSNHCPLPLCEHYVQAFEWLAAHGIEQGVLKEFDSHNIFTEVRPHA